MLKLLDFQEYTPEEVIAELQQYFFEVITKNIFYEKTISFIRPVNIASKTCKLLAQKTFRNHKRTLESKSISNFFSYIDWSVSSKNTSTFCKRFFPHAVKIIKNGTLLIVIEQHSLK